MFFVNTIDGKMITDSFILTPSLLPRPATGHLKCMDKTFNLLVFDMVDKKFGTTAEFLVLPVPPHGESPSLFTDVTETGSDGKS